MVRFQGSELPPGWRQVVLQVTITLLTFITEKNKHIRLPHKKTTILLQMIDPKLGN